MGAHHQYGAWDCRTDRRDGYCPLWRVPRAHDLVPRIKAGKTVSTMEVCFLMKRLPVFVSITLIAALLLTGLSSLPTSQVAVAAPAAPQVQPDNLFYPV